MFPLMSNKSNRFQINLQINNAEFFRLFKSYMYAQCLPAVHYICTQNIIFITCCHNCYESTRIVNIYVVV